jgi:hypothetical protein
MTVLIKGAGAMFAIISSIAERIFRRESPVHGRSTHRRNGFPPEITSLWTRIQTGKIKTHEKSSGPIKNIISIK